MQPISPRDGRNLWFPDPRMQMRLSVILPDTANTAMPCSAREVTRPAIRILLVTLLLAARCVAAAPPPATHEYTVTLDPDLNYMHVHARFDGNVGSVTARGHAAGRYLQNFGNCDHDAHIRMRNRRMILPAGGIHCMNYSVDLRAAADDERQNRILADGNFIVSPSLWLWRPELTDTSAIHLRFVLPEGVSVAVPWQALDAGRTEYRIGKSPESADAPAAFGRFDYREIDVPGARLRVSLMQSNDPMDDAAILRWVQAAATDVSLAYGTFPNPSPQVIVIPVADDADSEGSAVPFGRVVRDGGESVELFVNQARPLQDFLDDWTATHEFSHLMLPYVVHSQRWISEGFAQYYQNVLLARSGAYDDVRTWQKLYDGFERGRQSRPELSPNDAAAGGTRKSTMKVYWSGAAIALMADVALREASGGQETLDDVLKRLQSCCLPSDRAWSGTELFEKLDALASQPVFMPLYQRYADTIGFPDTRPLFARLGLKVEDGKVRIARSAALQGIRTSITELDSATASWREQLAAHSP